MTRLKTGLALSLAALLLGACAEKPMEEAPMAPAEPMPVMFDAGLLPSAAAKPILLASEVTPEGGMLEQGTLVTGKSGWAVHGEMDGVAWRYGSSDAGFLRVAGEPGTEWQYIQVAQSWGVKCMVDGPNTPCRILRLAPVEPGTMSIGGLSLDQHVTCVRAANPAEPATISVDGGAPVALLGPSLCLSGAESDALQQQMLNGQSVTITAGFYEKGPAKTMTLPTHGMKQALAMASWIVDQYKAGKLHAVE